MIVEREWAMPSADTFSVPPVARLLDRYLAGCQVVVDPFARNSERGTLTNDLNPETKAQYHRDARVFCELLLKRRVVADAVLFDPPYSPRQIAECYAGIGQKPTQVDTQNGRLYREVRDYLDRLLRPGGIAVSCGWNSAGFGRERGYVLREVLLVPHGGAHNDTIVTVETKTRPWERKDGAA